MNLISNLRSLLLVVFVILLPFQDTGLSMTPLGHLGTSFSIVPLVGIVALDSLQWLISKEHRVNLGWWLVGAYCATLTVGYIAYFGPVWKDTSLFSKAFNLMLEAFFAAYVVFGVDWSRVRWLHASVRWSFAISIFGVLAFDLNLLGLRSFFDNALFHFANNPDQRWHGFSPEASLLSGTLGSLGILAAAMAERPSTRVLFVIGTTTALALCGSKGGFITLILSILSAMLFARGRRLPVLGALVLLAPLGYLGADQFLRMSTAAAIRESTTFATRSTMALWSWDVVSNHPLGVGFGGFYPSLTRYLPLAMDQTSHYVPIVLNFQEVRSYMSTARFAGTKSFLLDFAVYFGIPFVIAFLVFILGMASRLSKEGRVWLMVALLFTTIAMVAYTATMVIYPAFLVLGICRSTLKDKEPKEEIIPLER